MIDIIKQSRAIIAEQQLEGYHAVTVGKLLDILSSTIARTLVKYSKLCPSLDSDKILSIK